MQADHWARYSPHLLGITPCLIFLGYLGGYYPHFFNLMFENVNVVTLTYFVFFLLVNPNTSILLYYSLQNCLLSHKFR